MAWACICLWTRASTGGWTSGPLFDFFEEMISTVSGACAAIEAFCIRCIIDNATGPLKVKAKKGKDTLSPEDVVRFTPLDEKVKRIVPDIMGVPSPAEKEVYDRFFDAQESSRLLYSLQTTRRGSNGRKPTRADPADNALFHGPIRHPRKCDGTYSVSCPRRKSTAMVDEPRLGTPNFKDYKPTLGL